MCVCVCDAPTLSPRLVEEVKDSTEVELETDDVYMNSSFEEFSRQVILRSRGGEDTSFEYHPVRHTHTHTHTPIQVQQHYMNF